jgi:chromosome segregation ATPase
VDAARKAETAIADAASTCRTLALEQEALAREIVDLGSLQPRDEVIQSMSRQLTQAREREADANAIAEAAEGVRDAARQDTAATAAAASAALSLMSAKLEDQITCADNLEGQLRAERARSSALESRLTASLLALRAAEDDRVQLASRVSDLTAAVRDEAAKFVAFASTRAAEQGRMSDALAVAHASTEALDTAQGALGRSEYARVRAEAATADADAVAVRADRAYTTERAAKVALAEELKRAQEEVREVRAALRAAEDRHRGVEADLAGLARKPTASAVRAPAPAKPSPPPGSPPPYR